MMFDKRARIGCHDNFECNTIYTRTSGHHGGGHLTHYHSMLYSYCKLWIWCRSGVMEEEDR